MMYIITSFLHLNSEVPVRFLRKFVYLHAPSIQALPALASVFFLLLYEKTFIFKICTVLGSQNS